MTISDGQDRTLVCRYEKDYANYRDDTARFSLKLEILGRQL